MTGRKTIYQYAYRRSADQDGPAVRRPVVVVGAGPVGLTAAIDLALRGVPVVVLDDSDRVGEGSRGIMYAKRSLEILDRLGVGGELLARGVTWRHGKIFRRDALLVDYDLMPEPGFKMPAFINLQQYYLEKALIDRAGGIGAIDLRWRNRVTGAEPGADCVRLRIDTPDGPYEMEAEWVVAADGVRSTMRQLLGVPFGGVTFEDRFLIADVKVAPDFPTERRFWFHPAFHSGQSALMHRQPDGVWRIDLQLGRDADIEAEQRPERVLPRLKAILGDIPFEIEWVSIYRFSCRRVGRFVNGRTIFAGDAAHQVSPFGARGGNSGIQDAENLAWKLAAVIGGEAGPALLDSYDVERGQATDQNIAHSTRANDFVSPHNGAETVLRDAVLSLAPHADFARRMINTGRASTATVHDSPLSTPDHAPFAGSAALGAPLPDAPVRTRSGGRGHLVENLPGEFVLLLFADGGGVRAPAGVRVLAVGEDLEDVDGLLALRLDASPGSAYLLRPDQHLCARWRAFDPERIAAARARALGHAAN